MMFHWQHIGNSVISTDPFWSHVYLIAVITVRLIHLVLCLLLSFLFIMHMITSHTCIMFQGICEPLPCTHPIWCWHFLFANKVSTLIYLIWQILCEHGMHCVCSFCSDIEAIMFFCWSLCRPGPCIVVCVTNGSEVTYWGLTDNVWHSQC